MHVEKQSVFAEETKIERDLENICEPGCGVAV